MRKSGSRVFKARQRMVRSEWRPEHDMLLGLQARLEAMPPDQREAALADFGMRYRAAMRRPSWWKLMGSAVRDAWRRRRAG